MAKVTAVNSWWWYFRSIILWLWNAVGDCILVYCIVLYCM